ncbi:uncharacterized protein V6R79_004581 [Siganus canaliculatus]
MKRPREDSSSADSDAEGSIDVGSESLFPGHMKAAFIRCVSPTTTTTVMARKKRRGIIEKRRRDRINGSLSELRRLVPTAFEKQGSSKLEKAEILQMTVDHLKLLQATGGKGLVDPQVLALDFLSLGFRECVSEVSRYLGSVEGLDSSDPLRSRLLSHLTSCCSQRDAALALTSHPHQQQPPPLPHPFQHWAAAPLRPVPAASYGLSGLCGPAEGGGAPYRPGEGPQRSVAADSPAPLSLLSLSASFPITLHGGFHVVPPSPFTSPTSPPASSAKPYRPWGAEVGAF